MDIEKPDELIAYLVAHEHIAANEQPSLQTLSGGVSNRAVWVHRDNGDEWVIKQALPKLRVEADWFSDPARIHREALGIRWLAKFTPSGTIPELIFEDEENHILAMTAVPQPHINWKQMLLRGEVNTDYISQFAHILAGIHRQSHEQRDTVEPIFRERSFFESLRVEPYYSYTASQQPESAPFYEQLIADTRKNLHTIVHGDYSPKNILVYNGKLVLLDHEVIHFGDPAFDVGFSMTHLLSKSHHVAGSQAAFITAAHDYWQMYQQHTVSLENVESRAVRHTLGCLLARVDGRSPLEYLTDEQRNRQRQAVLALIVNPPVTMPDLIDGFTSWISEK